MSQEQPKPPRITTHTPHGGATWWKWAAGAAVAALLIGGGYVAWKNMTPTQPNPEMASNTASPAEAYDTASAPSESQPTNQVAETASPEPAATASAETETTAPRISAHRRAAAHRTSTPEEVIGVTPVSVSTQDSDTIIVPGPRRPVWSHTPSTWRLSNLYPERALERGREGEALVHCSVRNSGALNCVQVSETPINAGFGPAALRVARLFRHAPQRADGSPAAGTPVDLRVVFRMAEEQRG